MKAAINTHPSALDYSLLGSIEFQQQHFPDAEKHLERALVLDPGLPGTRLTLAHLRNMRGNTEGALALLLEAKKMRPNDPETLYALGVICLQMDLVKDANTNLSRVVELQPQNSRAQYALASARIADHDLPGAIRIYQDLLKSDPGNAQVNYAAGATYFLVGNLDQAKASLAKSVQLQPDQVESYYYLALIAQHEGDHARSRDLLEKVLSRNPDHARARVALAMEYRSAGQLSEARAELEKATRADPKLQKAHYQLGLVLTALKETQRAKAEFEIAGRLRAASDDKVSWELATNQ